MHRRALVALVAGAVLVAGCGDAGSDNHGSSPRLLLSSLHGAVPDQHTPKPEFTLMDTSGHRYDLAGRTAGKVTLLFFGYTHCPDVCPTTMADIAVALRRVPSSLRQSVAVVFVTTDPWRDTGPVLRHWLNRFDPSFVGLTGTPTQIAGVEEQMGMPVSRPVTASARRPTRPTPTARPSGKYSIDHFAAVLVYGKDNRLLTLYPSGVSPADVAADLRMLANA